LSLIVIKLRQFICYRQIGNPIPCAKPFLLSLAALISDSRCTSDSAAGRITPGDPFRSAADRPRRSPFRFSPEARRPDIPWTRRHIHEDHARRAHQSKSKPRHFVSRRALPQSKLRPIINNYNRKTKNFILKYTGLSSVLEAFCFTIILK